MHSTDIGELIEAGTRYLEAGLPIVPLWQKKPSWSGKKPSNDWGNLACTPEDLAVALEDNSDPGIGLKLGPSSGIIDIESDSSEQEAQFNELFADCEPPVTACYKSPKGKHRLFKWDERFAATGAGVIHFHQLGCRVGAGSKAIQSVIPPTPGREWLVSLDDTGPAELPDTVVERLLMAASTSSSESKPAGEKIPAGERNTTLFRLGCSMRNKGFSHSAIEAALLEENASKCDPPLAEHEVATIARQSAGYVAEPEPQLHPTSEASRLLKIVHVDRVVPRKVDWLWPGYIPYGNLTILDGNPGDGKSQIVIDLASRLSRGDCMPPSYGATAAGTPGVSIILTVEDDPATTIRPRVDAAGGDAKLIKVVQAVETEDSEEGPVVSIPFDVKPLREAVLEYNAKMVVIDPLAAHLGEQVNANSDASVRGALAPLMVMAAETGCAVLLVRHFNKNEGASVINRGGGSIGIIGACRAGFVVARDPEDKDRLVLAVTKANLSKHPPSLGYEFESVVDGLIETSRVRWLGEVQTSAAELLTGGGKKSPKLEMAKATLEALLDGGPQQEAAVRQLLKDFDISESTYKRARRELGVVADKAGFQGPSVIRLPGVNGSPERGA